MALRDKLTTTSEQLLAGKKALADALIQVGITAVEPNPNVPDKYETFQSYADKIKRLMISNSFIFEINIPEEGFENRTKYKRTLTLPMGIPQTQWNNMIMSIVNSDTGYTPSNSILASTLATNNEESLVYPSVIDPFNNEVADGTVELEKDTEIEAIEREMVHQAERANIPQPMLLEDLYAFTVDYGDGSEPQEFISWEESSGVCFHTYEQPGSYTVTINGIFKEVLTYAGWSGYLIVDGANFPDKDGVAVLTIHNYAMQEFCTKVIAWGNTQVNSFYRGFVKCSRLTSIPMYDTTDSFKNVTTVEYIFGYTGLLSIPYDSNSLRGIFSNCPNLTNAYYCFTQNGYMTGEIPPTLFSNCNNITSLGYVFYGTTGLTGQLSDQMFRGLPNLSQIGLFFQSTQISGEVPATLFDENPMLYRLQQFLTNTKISGTIPSELFKNNPNVWDMACCFSMCSDITAIGDDLFNYFTQLQWGQGCFYHTGIQELQPNLLGSGIETTAAQANIFEMFEYCEKLTRIPSTILLETILYHDARALFSNCRNISGYSDGATSLQILDDFKDGDDRFYENYMQTVLGMFAGGNKLPDIDTIPVELCGNGDRLFPNFHVGMILLNDLTRVEIKDFVYDSNNKPIGWIYDSDSTYDYCVCFNNLNKRQWIRTSILTNQYGSQIPSELLVGSINYQDLYDMFYNERHGDTYTDIWLNWDVYQNNKDDFPVLQDVEAYKIGTTNIKPYIPTIYELRIATTFNYWMQMATDKIVNSSGGDFTSSNCYSISTWGATQTSCLANNSMSLTRTENGLNVYTALYYSNQNYRPFFKVEKN